MPRLSFATLGTLFGAVHLVLATNLALLVGCLPFVALLVTTDPALSWPLLALTAPLCAPSFVGAFTVFRDRGAGESITRSFVRGVREGWRTALALGAAASAALAVVVVDLRFFADGAPGLGALLVPLLALGAVLVLATTLTGLVAIAEDPRARLWDVVRAAGALAVRRWYLTALSLAVLGVQAAFLTLRPALAIGLAAAPVLYVVWANARYTLEPVLVAEPPLACEPSLVAAPAPVTP